jgi:hypothetical protein
MELAIYNPPPRSRCSMISGNGAVHGVLLSNMEKAEYTKEYIKGAAWSPGLRTYIFH